MAKKHKKTKRVQVYLHRDKESNYQIVRDVGIKEDSEAERMFLYLGSEEALVYDVDVETGEGKLVGAGGLYLSDEKITIGDIDV